MAVILVKTWISNLVRIKIERLENEIIERSFGARKPEGLNRKNMSEGETRGSKQDRPKYV